MAVKRSNEKKYGPSDKKAKKEVKPVAKLKKSIKILSKTVNYSLCIPTTVLANCRNLEQITFAIYQIAKTATIFNVGEIVVLNLGDKSEKSKKHENSLSDAMLIASLLQYFVTPPYLVNTVFKKQYTRYFQAAAKLPRLSALPFMRHRNEDKGRYREGLAIRMTKPGQTSIKKKNKEFKQTKFINIGKAEPLELKSQLVPVNVRVTVDTVEQRVVSPQEAYGDFVGANASFGYHVRVANNFGSIFTECAFPNGYSQAIWINSGDYYYNDQLKKYRKVETNLPYVNKIIKPTESTDSTPPANVLLVGGKWDHINESFQQSRDQFEGCDGAQQFFDGQLELPGAAPQGNLAIPDSCMISLTLVNTL